MTDKTQIDFFADAHDLPSFDGLGFAHNRLDRDTENRDETSLEAMMAKEKARYYLFHDGRVLLWTKDGRKNPLFCGERAQKLGGDIDRVILLGTDPAENNAPRLAVPLLSEAAAELEENEDYALETVRNVLLNAWLPNDQLGAIAQASSLLSWHANHQYCARCGEMTGVALAGARRDCPSCKAMHFPRTDPVVIMLAIHKDDMGFERCLLGHHTRFETPMFSTLAGFMEQGETLEDAVRREIFEESGIEIDAVRYVASQPWPFPSSLMLGCYAQATSTDITVDADELTEARWFTRQEIRNLMQVPVGSDQPHIPGQYSIAAWLIRGWAGE